MSGHPSRSALVMDYAQQLLPVYADSPLIHIGLGEGCGEVNWALSESEKVR